MEALSFVGASLTMSFWLVRSSIAQQRAITDRFIRHLQQLLMEQREEMRLHRSALAKLTGAVRRNSALVRDL
jgi:hypothetical protein